jgi:predicted SnoaL-like aldol condensation-catalyzing enzyme
VDEVLVHGRRDRLPAYFHGDRYIQHNPQMGDGLTGFLAGLDDLDQRRTPLHYHQIHLVLGSGNFVLTASEGRLGSQPTSFYDLFRVENGKLAEHWDTLEPLLPRAEWKNQNGKF